LSNAYVNKCVRKPAYNVPGAAVSPEQSRPPQPITSQPREY